MKDEEEHGARHLARECMCEVIFEGGVREKVMRTPFNKDGGMPHDDGNFGGEEGYGRGGKQRGQGVFDHGAFEQNMADGEPGRYDGGLHDSEELKATEDNAMVLRVEENNSTRQAWEPQAQMAPYKYAGYYIDNGHNGGTDPEQTYAMAFGRQDQGQLLMTQVGAGMKWYPQEQLYPQLPQPQPPPANVYNNLIEGAPRGPRALSEPPGRYDQHGSAAVPAVTEQSQPMVVSSDMMRSESS